MRKEEQTVRARIAALIEGRFLTAKDISRAVGVREKEVLLHLPHVARSVRGPLKFRVEPSVCLACGFVFRKRTRLKTPGRCPVCRSGEITETKYGIF